MKLRYRMTSLALVVGLTGCATAFNHTKVSDDRAYAWGERIALAQECANAGYLDTNLALEFGYTVKQYLGATVYDRNLPPQGFNATIEKFTAYSAEEIRHECAPVHQGILGLMPSIREEHAKALAWKNQPLPTYTPIQIPTYTPPYSTTPSIPQVTFGLDQNSTDHYLIQTPQGQRQCAVFDSGVVNCN